MRPWTQDGYLNALRFAAEAHGAQLVPGTKLPYLLHVALVCMEVTAALRTERRRDQELAVQCALLHDVVEDTETTLDELRTEFGLEVANGVAALSKDKALPPERRLEDSLRRIHEQPREIWMVKLADRITNLQPPPPHWSKDKIAAYREEAILIHSRLKDASRVLASRLSDKLDRYGRQS